MRHAFFGTAIALLCLGTTTAHAQPATTGSESWAIRPGPYARLNTGYSFGGNDTSNESWIIGAGLGFRMSPSLRIEGDFNYRPDFGQSTNFGIGSGSRLGLTNWTAMGNVYYDFNFAPIRPLVPYIGGGLGLAKNEFIGTEHHNLAWNAQAGVSYYLSEITALDFGYRYLDAGSTGAGDLTSHEITAAIRFGF